MALQHTTETKESINLIDPIEQLIEKIDPRLLQIIEPLLSDMDLHIQDLQYLSNLSPYLILDGHRTGVKDGQLQENNPAHGYVEGAEFSLRLSKIMQKLGCQKVTFLIHTLRNYSTMDRMEAIFDAISDIGKEFISTAYQSNIKLRYYGSEVHTRYAMAEIINKAEEITKNCNNFELNYVTNYSEQWGMKNQKEITDLPEINVIGRFTKGHYSGANIPGHTDQANFVYIQQASISENWTDLDMIVLVLSLLKSHLSLKGFVGGKAYSIDEKQKIKQNREEELWEGNFEISTAYSKKKNHDKRIVSFSPMGPMSIKF